MEEKKFFDFDSSRLLCETKIDFKGAVPITMMLLVTFSLGPVVFVITNDSESTVFPVNDTAQGNQTTLNVEEIYN